GKSRKKLKGEFGELELETPRDRQATFDPKIVGKRQTRWTGFDDKILSMYARGMTTREIQGHLEEIYGIEVSPTLISNVTEAVIEEVKQWQNRPLEELYPIVYLDALMVKVRDEGHIQNKAIYVVLGVNLEGQKEVLGLWVAQTEGAKFWLQVLTELKNRGVQDIFIACVDGLKGFPEAIETVYPKTEVQLCIVHLVRASLNYVPWKLRKSTAVDLQSIYRAATVAEAEQQLAELEAKWKAYPSVSQVWRPAALRTGILVERDGRLYSKEGHQVTRFGFHNLGRHSLASFLMDEQENPAVVQAVMRHSQMDMTLYYSHSNRKAK